MRKVVFIMAALVAAVVAFGCAAEQKAGAKPKVILLISEQNIEGPQRAWWASEIDLSTTEARLATKLIDSGYEVLEPSNLNRIINQDKAFRLVDFSDDKAIKLGNLSRANYVILGKAIASSGGNVPQSNMRSCFANISAKVINVKDGKVLAYLDASGSSAHMDPITGGREALSFASDDLASKTLDVLNKQGGK